MDCPYCSTKTIIIRGHKNSVGYVRNRECKNCGYKFSTADSGNGEKFTGTLDKHVNKLLEIDTELFSKMYRDKSVSLSDIATTFNIHYTTINIWRNKLGLPKRNREYKNGMGHRHVGRYIDVPAAARMIFDDGMRLNEVAKLLGVNKNRLSRELQNNGYCISVRRDCKPSLCEFYDQCKNERWAIQLKPLPCYINEIDDEGDESTIEKDSTPSYMWR